MLVNVLMLSLVSTERKDVKMELVSREELLRLLTALRQATMSDQEAYRAIQTFGEMNFQEARPEVEKFLKSEDAELRFVALKVLTSYWHLEEHWVTAWNVLEHDPDEDCRFRAAIALGALKRNTQDSSTLSVLARVVRNEHEKHVVREAAYAAMKEVLQYVPREQFNMATHGLDFEKDIDWDMVNKY